MNYIELSRSIRETALAAAELMRTAGEIITENKTDRRNVVTEYDKKVQLFLEDRLKNIAPQAEFFCEELGEQQDPKGPAVFIIDPIDGTMNFVKGFDHSAISIAYAEYGEVKVGVVYDVFADKMYSAVQGEGAFLNGRRINVSSDPLCDSVIAFGSSPYDPERWDEAFALARKSMTAGLDIRRRGSAALDLCAVAAGNAGLYFELGLRLWDYAAGMLLVREAGGSCECLRGGELPFGLEVPAIIAGPADNIAQFRELLD